MSPTPALRALQQQIQGLARRPTAQVHEVRIIMKILRAGLKLYGRDSPQLQQFRQQLQLLGRGMAPYREIESRNELLAWLRQHGIRVPANLASPRIDTSRNIRQRVKQAAAVSLCISAELTRTIRTTSQQAIKQQRKRMAKRVQRAARQAKHQPTLDNLHELRKCVKEQYYQLRYFTPTQGAAKKLQQRQRQRMGHQLGLVRDLTLLAQSLATVPPTQKSQKFLTVIESLAASYQRNVMKSIK